ncbi:MAG: hypothetical protein AAGC44_02765 [Planctomycetota bacterium]
MTDLAPTEPQRIIGYINGKPISRDDIYRVMAPQLSGEALAEVALDRLLSQRLAEQGLAIDAGAIESERLKLVQSLSDDENQAAGMLDQMREQRGLDDARFQAMLQRNAALRALIREEVRVADAAVRQAYELAYGPRYRVRLLVTPTAAGATRARQAALGGESFSTLAARLSTDTSRAQGGLLSPISPADTSYPKVIRDSLPSLSTDSPEDKLSPVLALDTGFALLYLEQVIAAKDTPYERVEAELRNAVRLQLERVQMQQLARSLLEQANIIVLDPILKPGWERQLQAIRRGGG